MTNISSIEEVFTINHLDNAIDYLEMVNYFLEHIDSEWKWKWVAISLHQALYSFMICALAGTSPKHNVIERDIDNNPKSNRHKRGAAHVFLIEGKSSADIAHILGVSEKTVEKWLHEKPYLISFEQALERVQSSESLPRSNIIPLKLSVTEKDAVDRLKNDFRNEFEHFTPKTWIDPMYGMAPLVEPVLDVIKRLALESNFIMFLGHDERRMKIEAAINKVHVTLRLNVKPV